MNSKEQAFWQIAWFVIATVVLILALINKPPDKERTLFSDQSVHIMAAMSIWHDFDLRYTLEDLERFRSQFPAEEGPRGLFLKANEAGDLYYAKPFLYSASVAFFYGVFGTSGFIIFNFILFLFVTLIVIKSLVPYFGVRLGNILALSFMFFSPFLAWVSILHPDLFISLLLTSGAFLILRDSDRFTLIAGSILLGLSVFEKPTFLIIVPFIILAASHLSWKIRLFLLGASALSWFFPTTLVLFQDNNVLSYQGIRFSVPRSPFPFEPGWIQPTTAGFKSNIFNVTHVFDLKRVVLSFLGNLSLLPEKLFDFIFGRQTGIFLYFPTALFLLILTLIKPSKQAFYLIFGFFGYLVLNWLVFPTNGFGGSNSYGSRYLMQVLPIVVLAFLAHRPVQKKHVYNNKDNNKFFIKFAAIFFVAISISFQTKVFPPSEDLVKNTASFLFSYPAKIFPFERSILPSIPIYGNEFRTTHKDGRNFLYRIRNFDRDEILIEDSRTKVEIVLYQYGEHTSPPTISIDSTTKFLMRISQDGKVFLEKDLSPLQTNKILLGKEIYKKQYFDLLTLQWIRWAPLVISFLKEETRQADKELIKINFASEEIADDHAPITITVGQSISAHQFRQYGITKRFGWSNLEPWGMWTSGTYADLSIPLPNEKGLFEIYFSLHSYVPPEHPSQEIDVYLNGVKVERWRFDELNKQSKRRVYINTQNVSSEGKVLIGFQMLQPVSPFDLGRGTDKRRLGIGLHEILIEKVD